VRRGYDADVHNGMTAGNLVRVAVSAMLQSVALDRDIAGHYALGLERERRREHGRADDVTGGFSCQGP
jgi:hypothetical protein